MNCCMMCFNILCQAARMKIRIRLPDGKTERVECLSSETIYTVIQRLREALRGRGEESIVGKGFLSLNKKDTLGESKLLSDCGICGGDLLYCLSDVQTTTPPPSSSSSSAVAAASQSSPGPARNLFGLPSAAPTSSTERVHEDGRGRRWTEEVHMSSSVQSGQGRATGRSVQGTAEEERQKRLKAIEMRRPVQEESERRGGESSAENIQEGMEIDGIVAAVKKEKTGEGSREETLALCVFAALTSVGFGDGSLPDGYALCLPPPAPPVVSLFRFFHFLFSSLPPFPFFILMTLPLAISFPSSQPISSPSPSFSLLLPPLHQFPPSSSPLPALSSHLISRWKGGSGTFSFLFPAERSGFHCGLAVKCLRMRNEFIVHAAVGEQLEEGEERRLRGE
eukprot:303078-Hanusia_phi.AAC.6